MVLDHLTLAKTSVQAQAQGQARDVGILYNLEMQNAAAGNSSIEYSREVYKSGRKNEAITPPNPGGILGGRGRKAEMAANLPVTNTGLTELRAVLNKWVEYLLCTVSKPGLKNPHNQEFCPEGGMSPHPPKRHTLLSNSALCPLSLSRLHPHSPADDAELPRQPST